MLSKICHKENNIFTHTWNKNTLKKGSGKTKPNQTLEANWKIEAINEKIKRKGVGDQRTLVEDNDYTGDDVIQ